MRWFRKPQPTQQTPEPALWSYRITVDGNDEFHVEQFWPNLSGSGPGHWSDRSKPVRCKSLAQRIIDETIATDEYRKRALVRTPA